MTDPVPEPASHSWPSPLRIPPRFNGPPRSGHGGYACGTVASLLRTPATVELRAPVPLDAPLEPVATEDGVELLHGDTLIASARSSPPLDLSPPATVDATTAAAAAEHYAGFTHHAFPTCFVCGPDRRPGDGLRIFPGPVADTGLVASPWTPQPDLAGRDGAVAPVFVWSALDCPSGFAVLGDRVAVLASMRVHQHAAVPIGERVVVLGWPRGEDGRKLFASSAVQDADGRVLAVADTLWIELRPS